MARLCPSRLSYLTDLSDREFARVEVGAIHNPTSSSDFLRRMHVEVDGVAQLVSELLDLARMDALVHDAIERIRPWALGSACR